MRVRPSCLPEHPAELMQKHMPIILSTRHGRLEWRPCRFPQHLLRLPVTLFCPSCCRDRPAVIANMSARVGSIGDNRLGGWYSCELAATHLLHACFTGTSG